MNIKIPPVRIDITLSVPKGSEDAVRDIVAGFTASELEILRKLVNKPSLKSKAITLAKLHL